MVVNLNTHNPVERIIENRVEMAHHRVFSAQRGDRPLHDILVEIEVVVNKVALVGIARPHPAIPFDAIQEEFSAV
ncbi:hypothetical protein D3C81_1200920 [compost metagenome]